MKRLFVVLAVFGLAACQTCPPRPTWEPDRSLPELASVSDRRICLDPGHGGQWDGAVAPLNGLRECDVNLAVALRAAELLRDAGAQVTLTRTADVELVPGNLSADLTARADVATDSDVFVSIHHNADITPGSQKNDLEVYYKLGEDGPSLDLARHMIHALSRRLRGDARTKRLLPGNYKVLRLSTVPAVLTESSYMTADVNAAFLATEAAVDAEAKAICAGLAAYFATEPPKVLCFETNKLAETQWMAVSLQIEPGPAFDEGTLRLELNGELLHSEKKCEGSALYSSIRGPLLNGTHTLAVRGRNSLGASFFSEHTFKVDRPAAQLIAHQFPSTARQDSGTEIMFELTVLDALGTPVSDGTQVVCRELGQVATTVDGRARFYAPGNTLPSRLSFVAGCASASLGVRHGENEWTSIRILRSDTGLPIANAVLFGPEPPRPLLRGNDDEGTDRTKYRTLASTEEGWLVIPQFVGDIEIVRAGFHSSMISVLDEHIEVALDPIEDGVLLDQHIVLDPGFGGRQPGKAGPTGLRASDTNLDIATRCARLLRQAGAHVTLLREDDAEITDLARVQRVERLKPDVYVGIYAGMTDEQARLWNEDKPIPLAAETFVGHYPASTRGMHLSESIAAELGAASVSGSVAYVIQQTSVVAVLVQPGMAPPEAASKHARQRAEDIYRGIISHFRGFTVNDP